MAQYCADCGAELPPGTKFCAACGKGMIEEKKTKYCSNCGGTIDARAEICPKCGVRVAQAPVYSYVKPGTVQKSPGVAGVLSFLFSGLGQIYNEQVGKAIRFLIIEVILFIIVLLTLTQQGNAYDVSPALYYINGGIFYISLFLYICIWIYNIYDAVRSAQKINAKNTQA
jgi:TM2 domain-containing membrane protein YozV/RNA polymerase subunit RPABC4/transcription elongation factor Spt4